MFGSYVTGLFMYCSILLLVFLNLLVNAEPRVSQNFIKEEEGGGVPKIGRLEYTIEGPEKISLFDKKGDKDGLSYLMQLLENGQLLDPFIQLFKGGDKDPFDDQMLTPQIIRPPSRHPKNSNFRGQRLNAAKTRVMSSNQALRIQEDQPIGMPPKSQEEYSHDQEPIVVQKSEPTLPPLSNEWKSTLFGPKGIFTEIFHFVNEKRQQTLQKVPQADLPPSKELDFTKLLDTLLLKSQNGNFDEPLPELPFIGICNRLSCGDIYRAIDEFKKSELFSNFQTALSLIQDPKGWDIIGQLLENPELIENFAGKSGNSIQDLWGKIAGAKTHNGSTKHKGDMEILPEDGDLGTDFTSLIEEKKGPPKIPKPNERELPEISLNKDGTPDYYSAVVKGKEDEPEIIDVEEETIPVMTTSSTTTSTTTTEEEKINLPIDSLPEISESIDAIPEDYEVMTLEKQIEETLPPRAKSIQNLTSYETSKEVETKPNAFQRRFITVESNATSTTTTTSTTTRAIRTKVSRKSKTYTTTPIPTKVSRTSTPIPTRASRTSKTTTPIPTTRKNFRRSDDYYAMYYDEG